MNLISLSKCILKDFLVSPKLLSGLLVNIENRINLAANWLCLAQDVSDDGGVSARYSLIYGWDSSYPETTGYIIPTFFQYSNLVGSEEYFKRALKMADWLLLLQRNDGGFKGGPIDSNDGSLVFDTGQILFGLIAAHNHTGQKKFLAAAIKSGKWLVGAQNENGTWRNYAFLSTEHTYYTRVAWALSSLYMYTGEVIFKKAASKNIDWALTKQNKKGWFDCTGFMEKVHKTPYTHTIAYTIRGILETGIRLGIHSYIEAAKLSADYLLNSINTNQFCGGTYDKSWNPDTKFSCLTGNCQIAIIFFRLCDVIGNDHYFKAGQALNRYVCQCQSTEGSHEFKGAIPGSFPIWQKYMRLSYPNWATKFFMDSLMMEKNICENRNSMEK
ncbi:MAG: hypothetical protein HF982_15305 [Desulfobacteraceae bacterium]|nr:hypothetical protein [Desulfobacteraceae bacterium]MBC2720924.1 hypothetical protein [Desulfobacteraceae bacterium]